LISAGYMLGTETVTAEFAYVDWQSCIVVIDCSITNNSCWQAGGQGSCRDFRLVRGDLHCGSKNVPLIHMTVVDQFL